MLYVTEVYERGIRQRPVVDKGALLAIELVDGEPGGIGRVVGRFDLSTEATPAAPGQEGHDELGV